MSAPEFDKVNGSFNLDGFEWIENPSEQKSGKLNGYSVSPQNSSSDSESVSFKDFYTLSPPSKELMEQSSDVDDFISLDTPSVGEKENLDPDCSDFCTPSAPKESAGKEDLSYSAFYLPDESHHVNGPPERDLEKVGEPEEVNYMSLGYLWSATAYGGTCMKNAASNWWKLGNILTSNRVFELLPEGCEICQSTDISGFKQELKELFKGDQLGVRMFHVGCQGKYVEHSTILAIGKNQEGESFAIFFDAQSYDPKKVFFSHNASPYTDKNEAGESVPVKIGGEAIKHPAQLYDYLMADFEEAPKLTYSGINFQPDRSRCTAYCMVFAEKIHKAVKSESSFQARSFIESFQKNIPTERVSEVVVELGKLFRSAPN